MLLRRFIARRHAKTIPLWAAGESDPIAMALTAADDKPHECKHIAFMSSQVLNGEGYGIVIRCGDNTFIGKINSLAAGTKGAETTLQHDINIFVKFIAILAITMAIVLFSAGLGRKMKFAKAFVNGIIVVLVANIPQGLPATVTSMLTLTAERMKAVSVLVKKTDIIEALGSATRIASDKTGTLTQNKMTVMNCWVNRQFKSASDIVATAHRALPLAGRSALSKSKQLSSGLGSSSLTDRRQIADVSEIEMSLPPAADKGKVLKTSSFGHGSAGRGSVGRASVGSTSRFGQDMASRMSMGKNTIGQAVCFVSSCDIFSLAVLCCMCRGQVPYMAGMHVAPTECLWAATHLVL
jgi:magnesium-transporting ATPase (P-type)